MVLQANRKPVKSLLWFFTTSIIWEQMTHLCFQPAHWIVILYHHQLFPMSWYRKLYIWIMTIKVHVLYFHCVRDVYCRKGWYTLQIFKPAFSRFPLVPLKILWNTLRILEAFYSGAQLGIIFQYPLIIFKENTIFFIKHQPSTEFDVLPKPSIFNLV